MDIDLNAEAKDKRLNRMVAITVVVLSVFTGLSNIKDGNIVQNMEQAQANSVDRWNEYQAARLKGKLAEATRIQVRVAAGARIDAPEVKAVLAGLDGDVAHYAADGPRLQAEAKGYAAQYDALNIHDDQFDASDAAIATAISIAAVAALVESTWVLGIAWVLGAFGLFMGMCGFAGWSFHPDILSSWLG